MYPASKDEDNDNQHHHARLQRFGASVEKFFILTPSSHFVNPKFMKQQASPPHHVRFCDDTKLPKHVHAPKPTSIPPATDRSEERELSSSPSSDTSTITELSDSPAVVDSSLASPVPATVSSVLTMSKAKSQIASVAQEKFSDISEEDEDEPSVNVVSMGDSSNFGGHNSWEVLTRKFVQMLDKMFSSAQHQMKRNSLNIAEAAIELEVSENRLRDIASVLEGAGLIEKSGDDKYALARHAAAPSSNDDNSVAPRHNHTTKRSSYAILSPTTSSSSSDSDGIAVGRPPKLQKTVSAPYSPCFAALQDETNRLANEEHHLDSYIEQLSKQIYSYKRMNRLLYLLYDDIKSLLGFSYDTTILGIRAPPGTTLEVPDPEVTTCHDEYNSTSVGTTRYEIHLTSRTSDRGDMKRNGGTEHGSHDPIRVHAIRPNISLDVPPGKDRQRHPTLSSSSSSSEEEGEEINKYYHHRHGLLGSKCSTVRTSSSSSRHRTVKPKSSIITGILRKRKRNNNKITRKENQSSINFRRRKRLSPTSSSDVSYHKSSTKPLSSSST